MKRIHLFEFEDFSWFPNWLRVCMTRFMMAMHKTLNSSEEFAELINKTLDKSGETKVLDLCSGSGGPMPEILEILDKKYGKNDISLTLSDLYPNLQAAKNLNNQGNPRLSYLTEPLSAYNLTNDHQGLRTLVCSLHHMKPEVAKNILSDAMNASQPICAFEISDNSFPKAIWWIAIPINIITTLFLTLLVRPMSWQQLVFTYLIPILPFVIAWDGAVSNARTYTLDDLDLILKDISSPTYTWEKGTIKGKSNKLYLIGLPTSP